MADNHNSVTANHNLITLKDSDHVFTIDAVSRTITNQSGKTKVMQYDHNSEVFRFVLDKTIEGHDMSKCNLVQIHWYVIGAKARDKNSGVVEILQQPDDAAILHQCTDESVDNYANKLEFEWLLTDSVTQYAGTLHFVVLLACIETTTDDQGIATTNTLYRWCSDINSSVSIGTGINAGSEIAEKYPDILNTWRDLIETHKLTCEAKIDADLDVYKAEKDVEIANEIRKKALKPLVFATKEEVKTFLDSDLSSYEEGPYCMYTVVDAELNGDSQNPVQNKTLYKKLTSIDGKISALKGKIDAVGDELDIVLTDPIEYTVEKINDDSYAFSQNIVYEPYEVIITKLSADDMMYEQYSLNGEQTLTITPDEYGYFTLNLQMKHYNQVDPDDEESLRIEEVVVPVTFQLLYTVGRGSYINVEWDGMEVTGSLLLYGYENSNTRNDELSVEVDTLRTQLNDLKHTHKLEITDLKNALFGSVLSLETDSYTDVDKAVLSNSVTVGEEVYPIVNNTRSLLSEVKGKTIALGAKWFTVSKKVDGDGEPAPKISDELLPPPSKITIKPFEGTCEVYDEEGDEWYDVTYFNTKTQTIDNLSFDRYDYTDENEEIIDGECEWYTEASFEVEGDDSSVKATARLDLYWVHTKSGLQYSWQTVDGPGTYVVYSMWVEEEDGVSLEDLENTGNQFKDILSACVGEDSIKTSTIESVKVTGKNLFYFNTDYTKTDNGKTGITATCKANTSEIVLNGGGSGTTDGVIVYASACSVLLPKGTYTASVYGLNKFTDSSLDHIYVATKNAENKEVVIKNNIRVDAPGTFTLENDTLIYITTPLKSNSSYNNTTVKIQIEAGSVATEYEPYKEASEIPLGTKYSLNGVGTYHDKLVITKNETDDYYTMKKVVNVGIVEFTGVEKDKWYIYNNATYGGVYYSLKNLILTTAKVGLISDSRFEVVNTAYDSSINAIAFSTLVYITFDETTAQLYPTMDDWKVYLAEQYANGTPVTIMFPLATPTEEVISSTLTLEDVSFIRNNGGFIEVVGNDNIENVKPSIDLTVVCEKPNISTVDYINTDITVVDSGLTYARGVVEIRKEGDTLWVLDSGVYNFTSSFATSNSRTVWEFKLPKTISNKIPNTSGVYGGTGTVSYFPALAYENVTYTTFNCQAYVKRTAIGESEDTYQVVYTGVSAINGGGLCGFHLKMPIKLVEETE